MNENLPCQRCGAEMTGQAVDGLCGNCLLNLALEPVEDREETVSGISDRAAEPGRVRYFGDYELMEEIARGGMGVVYRARQVSLNRTVALKMILAGHFSSTSMVQRFQTEAEAAARLEHPNIVPIYEIGRHEGQHYFSMRFLEGGTLTDAMARERFHPRRAAELMVIVARAVHHAHQRGILHRDLKPGNILLDREGQPHVADFGLAKLLESDSELTHSITTLGTPSYMAPEQASGQMKQATTATDIYSLGAILYELLTGRPPFRGATALETMRGVVEASPVRPRSLNAEVHPDLETICLKCLEKETGRRYPSGDALSQDLEHWLNGRPIQARPITVRERGWKWARREPVKAALVLVSCVAIAALTGTALTRLAFRAEQVQRKQVEGLLQEMERQREITAGLQHLREEDAELRLEFGRIDAWLNAEEDDYALAYLANVARRFPSNSQVAERVLSELSAFQLARLQFGPLKAGRWALSPDEMVLATADGHVPRFWNTRTGIPIEWKGAYFPGSILDYSFSSDGEILGTLHADSVARFWHWKTGERIGTSLKLRDNPYKIRLLKQGELLLALGGTGWDLWDLTRGEVINSGAGNNLHLVRVSPDERLLAVSPRDIPGDLVFIPLEISEVSSNGIMRMRSVDRIEFSCSGHAVAVAQSSGITVFETKTQKRLWFLDVGSVPRLLRFTPSDDSVLTVNERGLVAVRKFDDKSVRFSVDLGEINDVQFSPDGLRFAVAGGDRKVRVFSAASGKPISLPLEHREKVARAFFSKDSERLFTVTMDGVFRIWDVTSLPPATERRTQPPVVYRTVTNFRNTSDPGLSGVEPVNPPGLLKLWGDEAVPLPVPNWIPPFLETLSGLTLDAEGRGKFISQAEIPLHRERLESLIAPTVYERFSRWALTHQTVRPKSPLSTHHATALARLIAENTPESLREALWLAPTNGVALARLALQSFRLKHYSQLWADYELMSKRALLLAPHEPEVWLIRTQIQRQEGRTAEAIATALEAANRFPKKIAIREAKASLLEAAGQMGEALEELHAIHDLAAVQKHSSPDLQGRFHLTRARLLRGLNRAAEADAEEEKGLAFLPGTSDWPSRGGNDPGRNMYSADRHLPREFDPGELIKGTDQFDMAKTRNVRWIAKLGSQSFGAAAISGGKVFIGTNNDSPRDPRQAGDRSILMCLEERSGQLLWQLVVPKLKSGKVNDWENLGFTSSPTVVGERLYIVSTRAEVLCLDAEGMANGNDGPFLGEAAYVLPEPDSPLIPPDLKDADIIWRYDLMQELGVFPHNSSASSPLIVGDILYVATGNGMDWTHSNVPSPLSPAFIALDRHTGTLLAEDDTEMGPRILHGSWGSPSTGIVNGRQLVFFGGPDGWCYAFDANPVPGEKLNYLKTVWKADCNPPEYKSIDGRAIRYPAADGISEIIATPVFYRNRIYVATGQDPEHGEGLGNLVCIDATLTGDITKSGVVWRNRKVQRSLSTVSIDPATDLLFVTDFSGFLHCIDAETGETFWTHDLRAHVWPGGTLVADGKVYVGDEDGDFVIMAATKQKRVLSECNLQAPIYGTPVAANGVLYIQSNSHLFALQDLTLTTASR